ncbi:hypothetical protein HK105_203150 [Polyrhizophydium stewartii]|uniref:Uncharacterized protein n=1 Tax=Polyrhizophydium stewartii TaxID=2732419 RepID=A0ABR4NCC0_9FUNG
MGRTRRCKTCPLCNKSRASKTVANHRSQLVCIRKRRITVHDVENWRKTFAATDGRPHSRPVPGSASCEGWQFEA